MPDRRCAEIPQAAITPRRANVVWERGMGIQLRERSDGGANLSIGRLFPIDIPMPPESALAVEMARDLRYPFAP